MSEAKERCAYPSLYSMLYPWLVEIAHEHGYALGLHGSLRRDMDVIAVPWTEEASSAEDLVEAIADRLGTFLAGQLGQPGLKPHGRRAWSLILSGGSAYIDLSVMPRQKAHVDDRGTEEAPNHD